jgi:hypothetical protein
MLVKQTPIYEGKNKISVEVVPPEAKFLVPDW